MPNFSHLVALGLAAMAAGCVSDPRPTTGVGGLASGPQPRYATYRCDGGQTLTIENFQSSVLVVKPDGSSVEIPASPPNQTVRYGETPYALVLEGRDALYMKSGDMPLNCKR
ncbi:hypothetical protein [Limoniibacter endophyticus]|uniref:Uncharacterized protein n=1 Tax=Limoniibacter endophyticus TaxID=1565040 RepID=A0A8J3GIT4_9HYPH|nr:hypothetical protein [Limoniibacter endophyticus]GHC74031.1 hypothetical protein GCM10010136_22800 [Limoniibacter endophyticus]